jgi:hypothetical protein
MKTLHVILSAGFLLTLLSFNSLRKATETSNINNPEFMKEVIQSDTDLVIRINSSMNDAEVKARTTALKSLIDDFNLEYERGNNGEIVSFSCSSERFFGSTDSLDFIVLIAKDRRLESLSINDKK